MTEDKSQKYLKIVTGLTKAKFIRVTLINKSYQVVGASAQNAAPSAWKDDKGVLINENQMLKDKWSDHIDKGSFFFYKKNWKPVGQENDERTLNLTGNPSPGALKGENALLVRDREELWIVASFALKDMMQELKKGQEHFFKSMSAAIGALDKVLEDYGYGPDD